MFPHSAREAGWRGHSVACVWLTIIVTSVSPHRVRNPQAVAKLSQSAGYDDGKLGHVDGKQYTQRNPVFVLRDPNLHRTPARLRVFSRADIFTVGRPRQGAHIIRMTVIGVESFSGRGIPDLNGCICAAGGDTFAVG